MNKLSDQIINYMVACIHDFGEAHHLPDVDSFQYLCRYGALDFLEKSYDAEHLLSLYEVLEDLGDVCRRNGGDLA